MCYILFCTLLSHFTHKYINGLLLYIFVSAVRIPLKWGLLVCYSSKATTWYLHLWSSLKFLVWRLHHEFNIWMGARYICALIWQIVRCVYPRMFHSFWINFLMKLNINCIYTMNLQTLSLYVPINPWIDSPTEKLLTCSCVQYLIPFCLVCYYLVWKMDPLLVIKSPLTSSRLACQLVGSW